MDKIETTTPVTIKTPAPAGDALSISDCIDAVAALQVEQKKLKTRVDAHKAAIKAHQESDTGHVAQFYDVPKKKLDENKIRELLSKEDFADVLTVTTQTNFKVA